jgi:Leucine-rich repeat (LRR) protein
LTKLEILDVAINELTEIEGLESCAETLDELWVNNNNIADWKSVEYLGSTMKNLTNIYVAGNPVY